MAGQFIAVLAAAGLVSAGVAATGETRSAAALPTVAVEGMALAGAGQNDKPDCRIDKRTGKEVCDKGGYAGEGGTGALPIVLGAGALVGLAVALGGKSRGA